ncbi:MAG TPA: trypsin-like peptidase domain-containing protein [Pseudonocardiaceae bacterium]
MGAIAPGPAGFAPWQVRIHDGAGRARGAGILLTDRMVLTSAHVVPDNAADWSVTGHAAGTPPRGARVHPEHRVPPGSDVALLELDEPIDATAPLHRMALYHGRRVRMQVDRGVPVSAVLAGAVGEWVRLDPVAADGARVVPGFSGVGVVDERTGSVIGIVVAEQSDAAAGVSWMLPIETVVSHLPAVADLVGGHPATDDVFLPYRRTPVDAALADPVRALVALLADGGPSRLAYVIGGARRSAVLGALVTRSDPALRPAVATAPPGTVPPLACVDVAVDAAGRTVGQVAERLAGRLGIAAGTPAGLVELIKGLAVSMKVVVDSVDEATESDALLTELLYPLVDAGATVVVGAGSRPTVVSGRRAVDVDLTEPGPGSVADRLRRVAELVADADRAEVAARARHTAVAKRIAGAPAIPERAVALRLQVSGVRVALRDLGTAADDEPHRSWVVAALESCERTALRVRRRAEAAELALNSLVATRDELCGRLAGYLAVAVAGGLAEDPALGGLYAAAHRLLRQGPCDLAAAARAVTEYLRAVLARLGMPEVPA